MTHNPGNAEPQLGNVECATRAKLGLGVPSRQLTEWKGFDSYDEPWERQAPAWRDKRK